MTKSTEIQVRCSPAQKAAVKARAKKHGKNVSQFMLDCALQGAKLEEPEDTTEATVDAIMGQPESTPWPGALAVSTALPEDHGFTPPTPEEVDALAIKIRNTEGLPMRRAQAVALHRLRQ